MLREKIRWRVGLAQSEARGLTEAIFDEIAATCRQVRATPVFVYLPVLSELSDSTNTITPNEQYLLRYCETRQVRCLFLRQHFLAEQRKTGLALNTRTHWRSIEHTIAARHIRTYLADRGLAPQRMKDSGWTSSSAAGMMTRPRD